MVIHTHPRKSVILPTRLPISVSFIPHRMWKKQLEKGSSRPDPNQEYMESDKISDMGLGLFSYRKNRFEDT